MFGGYGLYRHGTSYVLVAASAFLGNTDVDRSGTSGSYDTPTHIPRDAPRSDVLAKNLMMSSDDWTGSASDEFDAASAAARTRIEMVARIVASSADVTDRSASSRICCA
ncbi:hypothetical protein [Mesorhizobium sp. LjNodule214]|uniref:hypothetical protein n=1 Tax=Mesorhizobium sp. LjNodule214 TaxID=3342252 RepID=UPI003ECD97D5